MKTSAAGRSAISQREANKLTAYKDSVGIWTIGVGHTAAAGEPKPARGMTITAAESDAILSRDLVKFEKAVNGAVKVPMTQNQFDALVSLAFNIGGGAFAKSTLVRKLNKSDYAGAADAFMSWNKAGDKTLKGLTTRRAAERKQFLQGATPTQLLDPSAIILPIEPEPAPAPELVPIKVPGVDKPMVQSTTMWAALSGVGITGIASAKDAIDSLTGLDWRVTMVLVGLGACAAAYWIISERVKYRRAQRDMVAGVKAASAEQ